MKIFTTLKWITLITLAALALLLVWKASELKAFGNGVQAYMYGYPLVTAELTRRTVTAPGPWYAEGAKRRLGWAPMNQFAHYGRFPDDQTTEVVAPNSDTLYSTAWIDVSKEPLILHTPEMGQRWLLMRVLDGWSNSFASLGTRLHGHEAKDYAIVGPGWQGTLPDEVIKVQSATNLNWIIGTTYTKDETDFAAVHALQAQYKLTPLSEYGKPYTAAAGSTLAEAGFDPFVPVVQQVSRLSTQQYFDQLAALMSANPATAADAPMLEKLAGLGIVPGLHFDFSKLSEAQQRGLDNAVWFVKGIFEARAQGTQGELQQSDWQKSFFQGLVGLTNRLLLNTKNTWQIQLNLGRYGTNYPLRALVTLLGYGANGPDDAIYPLTTVDANEQALNGAQRYVLHFNKNELPPARDFWSATMYDMRGFFVANPLKRYAIGDRHPLSYNQDGSLDLWLQHADPGAGKTPNWLPAPEGDFKIMLRLYGPGPAVRNGSWVPPRILRLP